MSLRIGAFAWRMTILLIVSVLFTSTGQAESGRVPSQIDGRVMTALPHYLPQLSETARDLGPVEPSFRLDSMVLLFKLSKAQEKGSEHLLAEQQDPSSPNYHRWLTPEEMQIASD